MIKAPRRRRAALRDQGESPFALLLGMLLDAIPFARGAALVDFEGETVDYAGEVDPFELRVAAATFQLLLGELRGTPRFEAVRQVNVACRKSGYVVRVLDPHYSLVVVVRRLGTFQISERVVDEIEAHLLLEAGFAFKPPHWHRVEVDAQGRPPRPRRIRRVLAEGSLTLPNDEGEAWTDVIVLGQLVTLAQGEHGYRVRLDTGAEVNLVCERSRLWFIDAPTQAVLESRRQTDLFGGR